MTESVLVNKNKTLKVNTFSRLDQHKLKLKKQLTKKPLQ